MSMVLSVSQNKDYFILTMCHINILHKQAFL